MKIFCAKHGCHFPEDFNIAWRCPMWKDRGLQRLNKKYKKMVWDTIFGLPIDEIWMKTNIQVAVQITGTVGKPYGNEFEKLPAYQGMTDDQRKEFQRQYFKWLSTTDTGESLLDYFYQSEYDNGEE